MSAAVATESAIGHDAADVKRGGLLRLVVIGLILLLSVGGYVLTSAVVRSDRTAAAVRRAASDSSRAQIMLESAKADVVGLGQLLSGEPTASEEGFRFLAGTTSASNGLVNALWVEKRAGKLIATYATTVSVPVDVPGSSALAKPVRTQGTLFAVTATTLTALNGQRGFYLLESARFGRRAGYLAVFVSGGWLRLGVGEEAALVDVRLAGRTVAGTGLSHPAAGSSFEAVGQRWRVTVAAPALTGLETSLPWVALAWPLAVALLAWLVGSTIAHRRRAEREVERIFDLALDMLGVAGYDGFFKRVNPAFERTLGYSSEELLSRPFMEFIHPDDHADTRAALAQLTGGRELMTFENRYLRKDGSVCWLEWSSRPVPAERLMYAAARDITERRRAEQELRDAHALLQASRDRLHNLADEQTALRRVATLVATGVPPPDVFEAVTTEMRRLLEAKIAVLLRYEPDDTATALAADTDPEIELGVGARIALDDDNVSARVKRTGRPATIADLAMASGSAVGPLRARGLRSVAGAPIVVEGRLWGAIVAGWGTELQVAGATEERMTQFTELVATAIANAHSRAELAASRARVVAAADEARRRIERDLHDGTQQRLVSLALSLRAADAKIPPGLDALRRELGATEKGLAAALTDLQEIARGIHPAILSSGGLVPALKSLRRRANLPVELRLDVPRRLPHAIEVAVYYVVSEALANAAKHACATVVHVDVTSANGTVEVTITDDGVGGADPERGSGLLGLRDRIEAVGGTIEINSARGQGTTLRAVVPVDAGEPAPQVALG